MSENNSPWIAQLGRTRPIAKGTLPEVKSVAIVGGGIAGVTTAYFTLLHTNENVVLLEANKIAHGATGHNAGQITSYFETPFQDFVKKYGLELAGNAERAIEFDARILLNEIIRDTGLQTPKSEFEGYDGLETKAQVLISLEDLKLKQEAGIPVRKLLIAKEWHIHNHLPGEYESLYSATDAENILSLLETIDTRYIAVRPFLSGCMNSALFTEELVAYLLEKYRERFFLLEEAPVLECILSKDKVSLRLEDGVLNAEKVILCTNGFEKIKITNTHGADIDTKFHHNVSGLIGYMAGFLEAPNQKPSASIYSKADSDTGEAYYYTTRRPFEQKDDKFNLLSIGGPEKSLDYLHNYDPHAPYPQEYLDHIFAFIDRTFGKKYDKDIFYFAWHGLMGYTPNGVRIVGSEPCNPVLLYNLGCNGVGILPSIYGARRIARILGGEIVEKSIFDPLDQRCAR